MFNKSVITPDGPGQKIPETTPQDDTQEPQDIPDTTSDISIKVLSGGGFVLSSNGEEYGYETKDQLMQALDSELQDSGGQDQTDMSEKKATVQKVIGGANEE